jgi:hypothetical protein
MKIKVHYLYVMQAHPLDTLEMRIKIRSLKRFCSVGLDKCLWVCENHLDTPEALYI